MIITNKEFDEIYYSIRSKFKNKKALLVFEENYYYNRYKIIISLKNNSYNYSKYNIFTINRPKKRVILSTNIEDKIVNHIISKKLLSRLEKSFLISNSATRKNMGTSYARNLLKKYIISAHQKYKTFSIIKIDISKFFYSINHNILIKMLNKYFNNKEISLIKDIIDTTNKNYINSIISNIDNSYLYKLGYGLPIGNLSSQILGIFYLSKIDHFIKDYLGIKYYIRYMDDFIILCNKNDSKYLYNLICNKIKELDLRINPKSRIYSSNEFFSFIGINYRYIKNKLIIKVINKKRMINNINKNNYKFYYNYFKIEKI